MWGHPDQDRGPARVRREARARAGSRRPPGRRRAPRDARRPAVRARRRRPTRRRCWSTPASVDDPSADVRGAAPTASPPRSRAAGVAAGQRGRRSCCPTAPTWSPRCSACGRPAAVYVPVNPRLTDRRGRTHDRWPSTRAAPRVGRPSTAIDARGPTPPRRSTTPTSRSCQFTSGTTGRPKPVLLTHSGVLDAARRRASASCGAAPAEAPSRADAADAQPHPGVAVAVGRASTTCCSPSGSARRSWSWTASTPAEFADARPPVRDPLDRAAARGHDDAGRRPTRSTDLAPLRFVRSITAPLSPLQARRFRDRFGIAVLNGYGQTEIGGEIVGWSAADSREHGDDKLGVGRPPARRASTCASTTPATTSRRAAGAHPGDEPGLRRRRRPRRPARRPTAGSAPATSAASTPTASCGSRAGCPT